MKGDFSRFRYSPYENFNGILPQQGKVLLDSDGIAQTLIENNWRRTAGRDWVGEGACVPSSVPDSFKISAASLTGGVATLTVGTGHVWADGLLARLESLSGNTVTRTATWLEPPVVPTAGSASDVADGTMDAVVLEVWQHAVNGFEIPELLIEPALGGPDTAERLQTSFAFRLARLNAGQTCADLTYNENGRGALTASLVPPITTTGDCPVTGSGGYSGFEHQLYRIEIADTNGAASQFKWSRVNGGLVGRGNFDPATQKIAITANLPAITGANQTSFYLEIEAYDPQLGFSHVITGALATLSGSTLQCAAAVNFGAYPSAAGNVFFRLWDGIAPVSSYPISATPSPLENGILLQFDPDAPGKYFPGDYWMFPVRAQGIDNPQTLINARKPEGIVYWRVPLAEITWASSGGGFVAGSIEDCRDIVPPLSRTRGCCTCRVGDGKESFGDFTSIQAAIDSLPASGGEVCILPGRYFERVKIVNRRDIVIHGCGWESRVCSPKPAGPAVAKATGPKAVNQMGAVITIVGSMHIKLRSFVVEADDGDAGILVDGTGTSQAIDSAKASIIVNARRAIDITIEEMVLTASTLPAILAQETQLLRIDRNRVGMKNVRSQWPAIYASGTEIHIERNWVGILTSATAREWLPSVVVGDLSGQNQFTTASGSAAAASDAEARQFVDYSGLHLISVTVPIHPGGIQIGGPSTDVYVMENEIDSGSWNGITLGSLTILDANGSDTGTWTGVIITQDECCTGTLQVSGTTTGTTGTTYVAGGMLTRIQIHCNRIRNMGMCGIGPVGFFDLSTELEVITIVGLDIRGNAISRTLLQDLAAVSGQSSTFIGYGAICVPDVQDLVIFDNTITDFGAQPGADVCGIFVLHGEMIEISRNQVLETRDWSRAVESPETSVGGARGGIVILLGTPLTFPQAMASSVWTSKDAATGAASATSAPVYEPGIPAVRVEHNVVRVPLNYALAILGLGPFSIVNNHLSCGGLVRSRGTQLAECVLIYNLGKAIELLSVNSSPSKIYTNAQSQGALSPSTYWEVSSGTVMFSNNICQLETTVSRQIALTSVFIFTPDALLFTNNECWFDAPLSLGLMNALLLAGTLSVVSNRFQESLNKVLFSGITVGKLNVTGQNISTHCLIVLGTKTADNNNLVVMPGLDDKECQGRWSTIARLIKL